MDSTSPKKEQPSLKIYNRYTKVKEVKSMGYTAKQLVEIAEAEIGYHEKATNANLDSKTANSGNKNQRA